MTKSIRKSSFVVCYRKDMPYLCGMPFMTMLCFTALQQCTSVVSRAESIDDWTCKTGLLLQLCFTPTIVPGRFYGDVIIVVRGHSHGLISMQIFLSPPLFRYCKLETWASCKGRLSMHNYSACFMNCKCAQVVVLVLIIQALMSSLCLHAHFSLHRNRPLWEFWAKCTYVSASQPRLSETTSRYCHPHEPKGHWPTEKNM